MEAQNKGTNDLMFTTEIDTDGMEFSRNQTAPDKKASTVSQDNPSTRLSENAKSIAIDEATEQREMEEFKDVIKELIYKERDNVMRLEEKIMLRLKKKAQSKGWDRQTGAKVAPLRILA